MNNYILNLSDFFFFSFFFFKFVYQVLEDISFLLYRTMYRVVELLVG